jgi:MFS family permease
MTAATLLGVSGLASLVGRIMSGMVADRWGSKRTLIVMLTLQAPAIFLYLFTTSTPGFYALALLFGASYGGVMPMYALLTREYFGARAMGTAYGAIFMLQAIGMGLGAFGGGWLYDHLGTYWWLFASATAAAAVAILFALPFQASRRYVAPAHATAAEVEGVSRGTHAWRTHGGDGLRMRVWNAALRHPNRPILHLGEVAWPAPHPLLGEKRVRARLAEYPDSRRINCMRVVFPFARHRSRTQLLLGRQPGQRVPNGPLHVVNQPLAIGEDPAQES